jgi:hypothetical protein
MSRCTDVKIASAVTLAAKADPCPWPAGTVCEHKFELHNNRPTKLYSAEVTAAPLQGVVHIAGSQNVINYYPVISSGANKRDKFPLTPTARASRQTVELLTVATYYDSTQQIGDPTLLATRFERSFAGPKETLPTLYELDVP